MNRSPKKRLLTVIALVGLLILELLMVLSLETLGWYGTGSAVQLTVGIFATLLPLLLALYLLVKNRFRFGLRSVLAATLLVAVFLFLSLLPLLEFRNARAISTQLIRAGAELNTNNAVDNIYDTLGLDSTASEVTAGHVRQLPFWLRPFAGGLAKTPEDKTIRTIWLNDDQQVQIFCDHVADFPSLQSIGVSGGVTLEGLNRLQIVLPEITQLDCVCHNVIATPKGWYSCLNNVRTVYIWRENENNSHELNATDLADLSALYRLEVLMVYGFPLKDSDAQILVTAPSLKRLVLELTAVTTKGVAELQPSNKDCIVQQYY